MALHEYALTSVTVKYWDYEDDPVYAESTDAGNSSGWGLNHNWRALADAIEVNYDDGLVSVHDNVAGEIHAVSNKATPVSADEILIEDSADSWNKKRVALSSILGALAAGSDKEVQFNDGGAFAGDDHFIWDKSTERLSIGTSSSVETLNINGNTRQWGDIIGGLYADTYYKFSESGATSHMHRFFANSVELMRIGYYPAISNAVVINETGIDIDTRVETSGNANALFIDGGNDRIGFFQGSPLFDFHFTTLTDTSVGFYIDGSTVTSGDVMRLKCTSSLSGNLLQFAQDASVIFTMDKAGTLNVTEYIKHYNDTDTWVRFQGNDQIQLAVGGVSAFEADGSGNTITINAGGNTYPVRIKSNQASPHAVYVDSPNHRVGIFQDTPLYPLHVEGDMAVTVGAIKLIADNENIELGAGGDSIIYYDGSDTNWNLRAVGTGDLRVLGGSIILPNNQELMFRNNADNADIQAVSVNNLDNLLIGVSAFANTNLYLSQASDMYMTNGTGYYAQFTDAGGWIFNTAQETAWDFKVYTSGSQNTFWVDSGNDRVSIATLSPLHPLHVTGDIGVTSGSILLLTDSETVTWGAGGDATIKYDGSNLLVNPRAVGSGNLKLEAGHIVLPNGGSNYGAAIAGETAPAGSTLVPAFYVNDSENVIIGRTSSNATWTGPPSVYVNAVTTVYLATAGGTVASFVREGYNDNVVFNCDAISVEGVKINVPDMTSGSALQIDGASAVMTTGLLLDLRMDDGIVFSIDKNGKILTTTEAHINQSNNAGAIPVLTLTQADVDQDMIEFACTVGVGNAIEAVGAKTLTTTHFIKVTITGVGTRYIPVGTIA